VWIKRDDLLGLSPGGNKTRKLEFLVADALAQGADTLITCGAPHSNHCRITLAAAVKEGLQCRFIIEERVPGSFREDANGNHFLFRLYGVESLTVVPAGTDMAAAMQREAAGLAARGRKAYVIPGGGSSPLGGLGYVAYAQELQQQLRERQLRMDALVVGSGSSGNHGGLLAGITGLGLGTPIIGIGVSREEADQAPLGAEVGARRLRPSGPEIARACVQRSLRERVLATQIQRAQRRHGSSRANAGPHGSDPARPCLHRQGHGRIDRHGPTGHMDCRRAGALCPYRWHVFTLRL
jgi:1-aminocyclopropane-1-carboxylate deaminase/D-cysteine desulfhydrase-like pyridoxal-dependent ACC family enzyme